MPESKPCRTHHPNVGNKELLLSARTTDANATSSKLSLESAQNLRSHSGARQFVVSPRALYLGQSHAAVWKKVNKLWRGAGLGNAHGTGLVVVLVPKQRRGVAQRKNVAVHPQHLGDGCVTYCHDFRIAVRPIRELFRNLSDGGPRKQESGCSIGGSGSESQEEEECVKGLGGSRVAKDVAPRVVRPTDVPRSSGSGAGGRSG